ncbi:MAG: arsenate reductase ArsC [Balneolaceae bacterium]|nr:arsenate reductase ArsC [Balneolaceae bacterium]MDR9447478.1 arsenate reductase ArsC [Balneolaceae bacterium]
MLKVAFVCIENSNRSQMAQAFAKISGVAVDAYSAGSAPSGKINPRAIQAMAELDYDLSAHQSTSVDDLPTDEPLDAVVSMGCGDKCPWVPAKQRIDWDIPDPREMDQDEFRVVRDTIQEKVTALLRELSKESA